MISRNELLTFNYYKKERFTGSLHGMRYLIQKESEGEEDAFAVFTWPGPYNFAATPEEMKQIRKFPFDEASLEQIADYLNGAYQEMFASKQ